MRNEIESAARRIYRALWEVLVEWFRVPKEPPALEAPPGETAETFRPAPGFLSYLKFWFWLGFLPADLLVFCLWLAAAVSIWWLGLLLFVPAIVAAIAPDVVAYLAIHLRFDATWYVMTSRSLRIRRGIWLLHEVTITFENVQDVKVKQGPVQRWFGIADLIVETAGGGGGQPGGRPGIGHRGVIEGIADAARLRDRIVVRLRKSPTAGLGDEPEPAAGSSRARWTVEHLRVLREIRDELAALRS
jgi:membrane protein YdbS with pleckstrin-like domain